MLEVTKSAVQKKLLNISKIKRFHQSASPCSQEDVVFHPPLWMWMRLKIQMKSSI